MLSFCEVFLKVFVDSGLDGFFFETESGVVSDQLNKSVLINIWSVFKDVLYFFNKLRV